MLLFCSRRDPELINSSCLAAYLSTELLSSGALDVDFQPLAPVVSPALVGFGVKLLNFRIRQDIVKNQDPINNYLVRAIASRVVRAELADNKLLLDDTGVTPVGWPIYKQIILRPV